jgi:tol-pal system protein YbgF
MLNLVPSRFRGAGRESGPRGCGGRWLLLALLTLVPSGCATKGDLRDLQGEIRSLATQQEQAIRELEALNLAVQDTLRGQTDALFESRGDILRRLQALEQELITLQELTGQNQRTLQAIRDLLEARRPALPPVRTEPDTGQIMDVEFARPETTTAGGAQQMYSAAVTQFNRGSFMTARRAFQQFLEEYPNHELAPDARMYLADILVQENRLEEAIEAFLEIPELHPTSDRVPEALYRVGALFIDLEDLERAREYLQRVVDSYPDSGAAMLARERLEEIS